MSSAEALEPASAESAAVGAITAVPCSGPERTAAAALATVARHHGLSLQPDELGPFLEVPALTTLADLVVASRLLGYDSVPLEGAYDDLAALELPGIVALHGTSGSAQRFAVLCAFDEAHVVIADPLEGATRQVDRDEFSAKWSGDCLQLVPDEGRLARTRDLLALHRNPLGWLVEAIRFAPPRAPKMLFLTVALGSPLVAGISALRGDEIAVTFGLLAISVAAVCALWQALFGSSCASCGAAKRLVGGLPLERAASVLYGALLLFALVVPSSGLLTYILFAAAGAHIWLLILLVRAGTICRACVVSALAVVAATGLFACVSGPAPELAAAALVTGLVGMAAATRLSRQLGERLMLWEARRLALSALLPGVPGEPAEARPARIVVWKRQRCASCQIFEAVVKPALMAELGDRIVIDERDPGSRAVPVPLILITGPMPVLFLGLPGTEDDFMAMRSAIENSRDSAFSTLAPLGAMVVVDPAARRA